MMVVCKFFLQGNCKFGEFCKFDHQLENYANQNNASILRQSTFGATPKSANTNVDRNVLLKAVANDMTVAQKGGQWLISSYSPFKEKAPFPGFEDQCFEEIRLAYYEAQKNGTVEQFKQQWQNILHECKMRMEALLNPTPEITNLLETIYNTPSSNSISSIFSICSAANKSLFGNQPQNTTVGASIFAGPQQQGSIFGGQQSQHSSSIFANQATGVTFSAPAFSQQTQSFNQTGSSIFPQTTFGAVSSNHTFGTTTSTTSPTFQSVANNSIFGGQAQNPAHVFPQPQANSVSHVFAGPTTTNIFPPTNIRDSTTSLTSSTFGGTPTIASTLQPQSIFAATTTTNIFGNKQSQINVAFSDLQKPSVFGGGVGPQTTQTPQATSPFVQSSTVFGGSAQPQTVFNTANTAQTSAFSFQQAFNSTQQSKPNIFGSSSAVPSINKQLIDESIYSKLEDLAEEEIKWFESAGLDIMNIPEKPPTYEMCFKA